MRRLCTLVVLLALLLSPGVWAQQIINPSPAGITASVTNKSANYTALATDYYIRCTAGSGGIAITLPASTGSGRVLYVKKIDSAAGGVTLNTTGGDTIDGAASGTLVLSAQYDSIRVIDAATGTWDILSQ